MDSFFEMWDQHLYDNLVRPELDLDRASDYEADSFFYDDDVYIYDDHDQPTEWERKEMELNISAPDPDDLCEGCGRSHKLCDCFDEK